MAIRIVAALLLGMAWTHPVRAQELLEDTRLGFKLRAPDGYTKVPLQPGEEWVVARWISDRAYFQRDESGFSVDHKPELFVIAFPSEKTKQKLDEEKRGTGKDSKTIVLVTNPYKDYRDYLKQTYHEGGFYISKEDKAEVQGVPVECIEIKVEKGLFGGPRKIVTWIFKNEDCDFAVQFELVENAWPKLKGTILSCMRSFRRIGKDSGAAADAGRPGEKISESLADLTPAQRAMRRRDMEKQSQDRFTKALTEGWTAKKHGRIFVLNHADDRYAEKIAENANAVLDYLDESLGYIGPGEYVRAPVVRICKDYDEARLYDKGGSGFSGAIIISSILDFEFVFDREYTTYKDTGSLIRSSDDITSGVCRHWFYERDQTLYQNTPRWLSIGLMRCFGMSRAKGRKLDFFNDSWERVGLSQQVREGRLSKIQDLVKMDPETLSNDQNRYDECAAAARFLLTGPKRARDALKAYFDAIGVIARRDEAERKKSAKGGDSSKPKTLEEEDAKFKAERTQRRDAEKNHLEEVYQAAFGSWSEADWKSLQSAYEKSLG